MKTNYLRAAWRAELDKGGVYVALEIAKTLIVLVFAVYICYLW